MTYEHRVLQLGSELRRLREEAGAVTGKEFAERIGWVASKVSRIETGTTLLSPADLAAWLDVTGAAVEVVERLTGELLDLRLERARWKRQLRHGHAERQRAEAVVEQRASRIVQVDLFLVPGLVQVPTYARRVFELAAEMHGTISDTDAAVRERIRRQDVLYDPAKEIELLVGESAFRYPICSADVLRTQIDRCASVAGLSHVRFGLIPMGVQLPTITMHGYGMADETVMVEVNHTEITTSDPDDVSLYRGITDRLWDVADAAGDPVARLRLLADA